MALGGWLGPGVPLAPHSRLVARSANTAPGPRVTVLSPRVVTSLFFSVVGYSVWSVGVIATVLLGVCALVQAVNENLRMQIYSNWIRFLNCFFFILSCLHAGTYIKLDFLSILTKA